jgi:hypothetical protein
MSKIVVCQQTKEGAAPLCVAGELKVDERSGSGRRDDPVRFFGKIVMGDFGCMQSPQES